MQLQSGFIFSIICLMSMPGETFFTSIGCMDGRVQGPVAEFGREKFGGQFADAITEPGREDGLGFDLKTNYFSLVQDMAFCKSVSFKIAS